MSPRNTNRLSLVLLGFIALSSFLTTLFLIGCTAAMIAPLDAQAIKEYDAGCTTDAECEALHPELSFSLVPVVSQ